MRKKRHKRCLHRIENIHSDYRRDQEFMYYCPNCDEELRENEVIILEQIDKEKLVEIVLDIVD